ncbi:unnamed protein product [Moneuplotes crassus]|uniref:Uncharacterized protein n=1 Tax=Euplotes crassus TaxID=5936 RepID=A0AAD1XQB4_EUPCR|nr:unnamed protein product [Moneuplotes crassus]
MENLVKDKHNEVKYFCSTCNEANKTFLFDMKEINQHDSHDYYVLQKPERSLREMADKINSFKKIYDSKIDSLTVNHTIVYDKLLEEARIIKNNFESRLRHFLRSMDKVIYDLVSELKEEFLCSTSETQKSLKNSFMGIIESHTFESGKDSDTKLRNANKMLNEINQLQHFHYTIDETANKIEKEFETIKEIMEQKIYTAYGNAFQSSDLFSQFIIVDNSAASHGKGPKKVRKYSRRSDNQFPVYKEENTQNGALVDNKSESSVFQFIPKHKKDDNEIIILDDDESIIDLNIKRINRLPINPHFKRE